MKKAIESAAVFFLLLCCSVQTLAAEPTGQSAPESAKGGESESYLLIPPRDPGPVVVRAAFHLLDIDDIDDEEETVQFTGVLTFTWQDKRQAFDPEEEKVVEKIYQGNYQFNELSPAWYPQVVLVNESGLYENNAVLLRVKPDGTSTLIQTVNAIAETDLNMRRYPFDRQRLEAIFEVLGFNTDEVVFEAEPRSDFGETLKIRMSGWKLKGLDAATRERVAPYGTRGISSIFVVTIDVERQSLFMLRLVVLPLIWIVALSWTVFWMDRSALGDRINVSFIGILTAVAYQNVVSDSLPQISYVTLMNAFLNISFLVMCATVLIHLLVDAANRGGDWKRGDLIDRRCRWIFPLVYFGALAVAIAIAFVFF